MTDKEIKKLTRQELLELLIDREKENAQLRAELQTATDQLSNRELRMKKSGTLADASLQLNGIFEAADEACKQYKDNIKMYHDQIQTKYSEIISYAETKAAKILKEEEEESQKKISAADLYWDQISTKLEAFYNSHPGLREMMKAQSEKRVK